MFNPLDMADDYWFYAKQYGPDTFFILNVLITLIKDKICNPALKLLKHEQRQGKLIA